MHKPIITRITTLILYTFSGISILSAQPFDSTLFDCMQWRMIGPHRGGRTVGACGVVQHPNIFYIGVNNGGVWKTIDYGRTWKPIFDEQPTGSIGDVKVTPSNPNVIYVGTGEGLQRPDLSTGNGMYKSTDAGITWTHLGLNDVQQIGGIDVDPTNENRVFVAALGHPYGPNTERGIYRSTNGGQTWERVLYKDENTGAIQVTIDPKTPNTVYASLWAARLAPWENGKFRGPESGLYKSTDGGTTWKKLIKGLPTFDQNLGRIGFCIAPGNPQRLYATVDADKATAGIYRSDDAGESWTKLSGDERLWGRGEDFAELKVHPKNPDIVFIANIAAWKSTDGGKNWIAFRGAPGGDDPHRFWINPDNPDIILLAGDQGAIITVNGGETWSSWYNQPTAQFYHVSTDNAFPYNVYGGQQESGSVGIVSRSNDGIITYRDWHPVGAEEWGYVAADPLDPNIVYGGKLSKYDRRTGQVQDISPETVAGGKYRFLRTAPVIFSPADPKTLYYAGNVLFKTSDGGHSWEIVSPDLSRESWDVPENVGVYTTDEMKSMPRRGVIYTIAPSALDVNTIWAGTDDGLIHITKDAGKTWKNVTPPAITSWSKISLIDAGHFDVNTAYVAVNRIRLDDMHPHIYRTHDGGNTWTEIVKGLPDDPINAVREDPLRKGLLFAGSERNVHVSFDDGGHWQSLRLNMPAISIRDLVVKDDDIVVGTHGRSFWILDNITPLRQLTNEVAAKKVVLYQPQNAIRVRWSLYPDTPIPQEEPAGQNPPDGAIIDYYFNENISEEITLDILDASEKIIRHYSSKDTLLDNSHVNFPEYWIRPQQILSTESGSHRFLWDLHYQPLNLSPFYPISAVYANTAPDPTSPWVMPGTYTVKLTVNNDVFAQPLMVRMDPRVTTSIADLQQQFDLSLQCYETRREVLNTLNEVGEIRKKIATKLPGAKKSEINKLKLLDQKLAELENGTKESSLSSLNSSLPGVFGTLQGNDMPVTTQAAKAASELSVTWKKLKLEWEGIKKEAMVIGH